jgi:uncharacterized protein (DUF488 family)
MPAPHLSNPQGVAPTSAVEPAIFTIGYGTRTLPEFLGLLLAEGILYLIDVRSQPFSRVQPEFTGRALASECKRAGIHYLFMGDTLGGRPNDPAAYSDGKVDYSKRRESAEFQGGLSRLLTAWDQGLKVALLCAEKKPEECHRAKLIGQALAERGIPVLHIDEKGALASQQAVMARATGGYVESLFGEEFLSLQSRRTYEVPAAEPVEPDRGSIPELIVTIGAYGFDEAGFLQALTDCRVDTFCDLRGRRGMRGSAYAFANSQRLQGALGRLGIRYRHLEELAPTPDIRALQKQDDEQAGVRKREREELSPDFARAYQAAHLAGRAPEWFLAAIGPSARRVALFCVERAPVACHRSLVAGWLSQALGVPVRDLVP